MRVLIGTASSMGLGGVRSHIESLRHALSIRDIRAELMHPDDVTVWWKARAALRALGDIDHARAELTRIRTNNVWKKVQVAICKENFNLVHAHDVLLASRASKLSIPVILTVHGPLSREAIMLGKGSPAYLKYLRETEEKAYERVRAIIAVDTGQKDILIGDYRIPPEKVHVIHNAVDTNLFAPQPFQVKTGKPFFLVPRRLVPKNGVHVAIEAFRLLSGIEAQLFIAGDGPERPCLERLVRDLGLDEQVRFLGFVDRQQIRQLISASVGVIIPSVPSHGVVEATSIAALEGMSAGKPVFASNVGGLAEIIKDKETGFLFEAGNWEALGILLLEALRDIDQLRCVGKQARKYVIENHSLEVWIQQIIEVYQDACQE